MAHKPAFDLDATLLALADPTRRAILATLAKGEARVTDVADPFEISLNSVSKHIRTLEGAGLVRRRKQGREYFLSLEPGPIDRTLLWLTETRATWNFRLNRLASILAEQEGATEPRSSFPTPMKRKRK
jgi:DNA-binding transcriptional ArsR family regulator